MLKVLKFGGSSMADAHQFAKVKAIVDSDPSRRVVVVSAAGKRSRDDHKLTDLLYLCYAHLQYGVSCDAVFDMIRSRYLSIRDELHLSTPLEAEFAALREKILRGGVFFTDTESDITVLLRSTSLIFGQIRRRRRTWTSRHSHTGRTGTIVIVCISASRSGHTAGVCIIMVIAACCIAARHCS